MPPAGSSTSSQISRQQGPRAVQRQAHPEVHSLLFHLQEAPAAASAGDDEPKPAPKPKNPLDLLPPSKMILDSWKRLYSNTPSSSLRDICIKGLWQGADIPKSPNNEVTFV